MKAILVIDVPQTITKRYLNKDVIVQLWNKDTETYIMHDICTLKPLPQKKREYEEKISRDDDYYEKGWNDCIDEILGEEE